MTTTDVTKALRQIRARYDAATDEYTPYKPLQIEQSQADVEPMHATFSALMTELNAWRRAAEVMEEDGNATDAAKAQTIRNVADGITEVLAAHLVEGSR